MNILLLPIYFIFLIVALIIQGVLNYQYTFYKNKPFPIDNQNRSISFSAEINQSIIHSII
jgi:hypothetical protein